MPSNSQITYIGGYDKPTFPYRTVTSPVDDSPHFITGSQNALATVGGWLEKRAGFSDAIETALSSIPGTISRIFTWQRWAGSTTNPSAFFIMVCAITGSTSTVWKLQQGVDTSFLLLHTDPSSTSPFDFILSNNFVFFGNATTRGEMLKWDGTDVSLWGVDAPLAEPTATLVSGNLPGGLDFDPSTGTISGTPTATGTATITATVTDGSGLQGTTVLSLTIDAAGVEWVTPAGALPPAYTGQAYNQPLTVQGGTAPYVYAIHSGVLPTGIVLSGASLTGTPSIASSTPASFAIAVTDATNAVSLRAFTLFVGSGALSLSGGYPNGTVGSSYSATIHANGGTSPYTYAVVSGAVPGLILTTVGNNAQLAGTPTQAGTFKLTLQAIDTAPTPNVTEFPLSVTIAPASGVAITTADIPDAQVGVPYSQAFAIAGGVAPYTFSISTGSVSAQTGYVYGYTYTSTYGHESAMSPLSANTELFTNFDIRVSVTRSDDPQVTGINLYRSTDGGDEDPAAMRLVASLPNTTDTTLDATIDIDLGSQTGPALYLNNPPQPLRGFVWSNGRIWGFKDATTWFTGNEEITNGIPVECMSNAQSGNYYGWPSTVGGLGVTPNGVDIALSEQWWQVSGDTLDTFRKSQLLTGGGALSPTAVTVVGSTVFWVDTAHQVWSSADGEIGEPIRPDLANLNPSSAFLVYHKAQTRNWLCLLDPLNAKLFLYDLDLSQWQTPWTVSSTSIWSGQTSSTRVDLLASFPTGHVRTLSLPSSPIYNDDGTLYSDALFSATTTMVPGRGTSSRNHAEPRQPAQFEMETSVRSVTDGNGNVTDHLPAIPDYFWAIVDDDPTQGQPSPDDDGDWTPLYPSEPTYGKQSGRFLAARRWDTSTLPIGVRTAFAAQWTAEDYGWKIYSISLAVRNS
jgi:hypothetical protein